MKSSLRRERWLGNDPADTVLPDVAGFASAPALARIRAAIRGVP